MDESYTNRTWEYTYLNPVQPSGHSQRLPSRQISISPIIASFSQAVHVDPLAQSNGHSTAASWAIVADARSSNRQERVRIAVDDKEYMMMVYCFCERFDQFGSRWEWILITMGCGWTSHLLSLLFWREFWHTREFKLAYTCTHACIRKLGFEFLWQDCILIRDGVTNRSAYEVKVNSTLWCQLTSHRKKYRYWVLNLSTSWQFIGGHADVIVGRWTKMAKTWIWIGGWVRTLR